MKNTSTARTPSVQPAPIRVFIVDDDERTVDAVSRVINNTPDMLCVGSHYANTGDLPGLVRDTAADLVIVDVVLQYGESPDVIRKRSKPTEWNGIDAVITLRNEFAESIKIIVWTHWKYRFERDALAAGADSYCYKILSNDELRKIIRDVYSGRSTRCLCPSLVGIELIPKTCTLKLKFETGEEASVQLRPQEMGFLYYRALERLEHKAGDPEWLRRLQHSRHGGGTFKIQKYDLWIKLNKACGSDPTQGASGAREIIAVGALSKHCTMINRVIKDHLGEGFESLIIGARREGSYTITRHITSPNIVIHDPSPSA
jgi:DNA-binding NarL/FixJ family response regulator